MSVKPTSIIRQTSFRFAKDKTNKKRFSRLFGSTSDGESSSFSAFQDEGSSDSTAVVSEFLQQHFLFSNLKKSDLQAIMKSMKRLEMQPNSTVIHEGQTDNDCFFLLERGVAGIYRQNQLVSTLKSPCCFEDLSLVSDTVACSSIVVFYDETDETSRELPILWKLSRTDYRQTLANVSSLYFAEARSAVAMIHESSYLTSHQVNLLAQSVEIRSHLHGSLVYDSVVNESEIVVLIEGAAVRQVVESTTNPDVALEFGIGTCLGFNPLQPIQSQTQSIPETYYCIASTFVRCAALSKAVCNAVLGSIPALVEDNTLRNVIRSSLCMYEGLTDFQISEMVRCMKENVAVFAKGEYLIESNQPADKFLVLMSGKVKSFGMQQGIGVGDGFGLESLSIDPEARNYQTSVISLDDETKCYVLQYTTIEYLGIVETDRNQLDTVEEESEVQFPQSRIELSKQKDRPSYQSQMTIDVTSVRNSFKKLNRCESAPTNKLKKMAASRLRLTARSLDDFQVLHTLGQGSFGKVKLARHTESGVVIALKVLNKYEIVQSKQHKNVVRERRIMTDLKHPFIANLYGSFQDQNCLYMMLEFVQGGELQSVIHGIWPPTRDASPESYSGVAVANDDSQFDFENTPRSDDDYQHNALDASTCQFYAACIVCVLDYIHLRSIAFRDLKPENLLIDCDGYIKFVDWGFAKICLSANNEIGKTFTLCGTPEYVAPESVLGVGHSVGVDCWSLGVILFEMATGFNPFLREEDDEYYDPMKIAQRVVKETLPFDCFESMTLPCMDLIRKLCAKDPASRIGCSSNNGIKDIMNHEFFTGISWTGLYKKWTSPPWKPAPVSNTDAAYFHHEEIDDEYVPFDSDVAYFEGF